MSTHPSIETNQSGQLSQSQRDRLRRRAITFGIVPILVYVLIIVLYSNAPNKSLTLVDLAIPMLLFAIPTYHAYRHVLDLSKDLREGIVVKDCGTISDYMSIGYTTNAYGRQNSMTSHYILVDNKRRYEWNQGIEGGFDSGKSGCIYFAAQSKHVLAIDCPKWESRAVKHHTSKMR